LFLLTFSLSATPQIQKKHILQAMTLLAVPLLVASGKPGGPADGSAKCGSSGHKGGSAATFLKDKKEQKVRESADSCGRMGVAFSPMVFDT